jgi:hypothetical protein
MAEALKAPNGRAAIEEVFGELPWHSIPGSTFVRVDPLWEEEHLVGVFVDSFYIRMHKKLASLFVEALMAARAAASVYTLRQLGGYCPRRMKTLDPAKQAAAPLSTHSWGIAFDINWNSNPFSTKLITDIPAAFVEEFKKRGWNWGGDWRSKKDPMHFQFCTGY